MGEHVERYEIWIILSNCVDHEIKKTKANCRIQVYVLQYFLQVDMQKYLAAMGGCR